MAAPRAPNGFSPCTVEIARGLVFDFRIQLGTKEDHDAGDPHPHHEANAGAQGAVGSVIVGKFRKVPGQQARTDEPCDRREYAADAQPLPARFSAARSKPIKNGEPDDDEREEKRPAQDAQNNSSNAAEADIAQHQRQHDHGSHRQQSCDDAGECKRERYQVKLDETALFLLIIHDVQRVHDRLHACIGAPECHAESKDESEAELRVAFRDEPSYLLLHNVDGSAGQKAGNKGEMLVDGGSFGKEAVQRDQRGDAGKQRKQTIEYHAGCYRQQTILADLLISAPQNIFPSCPRDLPRRGCLPAAAGLPRPFMLNLSRLVRAAGCAERARSRSLFGRAAPLPLVIVVRFPLRGSPAALQSIGHYAKRRIPKQGRNGGAVMRN